MTKKEFRDLVAARLQNSSLSGKEFMTMAALLVKISHWEPRRPVGRPKTKPEPVPPPPAEPTLEELEREQNNERSQEDSERS